MEKKEKTKREIALAFDFVRYLIDHPDEIAKIPDGSEVSFHDMSNGHVDSNPKQSKSPKSIQVNVKRNFEIKKRVA